MASTRAQIKASRARVAAYNRALHLGEDEAAGNDPYLHGRPNPLVPVLGIDGVTYVEGRSPMWTEATRVLCTRPTGGKVTGWDRTVVQTGGESTTMMVRNDEVRPTERRGFTGTDNGGAQDALGDQMRHAVAVLWELDHGL